ncbi:MAG: hypothetical protein ACI87E_002427 [Mariniblastus sp.]|jgi:hypothetical protein
MPLFKTCQFLAATILALCLLPSGLVSNAEAHDVAKEMTSAANLFLNSLDEKQRQTVGFEFDHELRKDWQFIPMERKGLGFNDLQPDQRLLALSLVQSALSHRGFSTTMKIMALEQVLHELENNAPKRDPEKYHVFMFGKPSIESTWGWRIEGHHLSISFTIVDGQSVVTTPAFFGSNPGEVKTGKLAGLRVLGQEEDLGRALVKQLSVEQKKTAILEGKAPRDVINGPGRKASPLTPSGLPAEKMTDSQKKLLRDLIGTYVGKFRSELEEADWKKVENAGFDKICFAWAGPIAPGKPHYFRVQGPTFILEYDNTQNKANHVHAVWRDFNNDFGEDLLKQHYETAPHGVEK